MHEGFIKQISIVKPTYISKSNISIKSICSQYTYGS